MVIPLLKKEAKKIKKPIVAGIVIPDKWDNDGKVIRVAIHTYDEKSYLVEHNRKGRELLSLIHKKVEAAGKIRERLDGKTIISIQNFNTIEPNFENNVALT